MASRITPDAPKGVVTNESSPGGFFGTGDTNVSVARSSTANAQEADEAARNARGWAVGDSDGSLTGWSATNNAKYYSGEASTDATAAAGSASAAAGSASAAVSSASAAAGSASAADTDARMAAASAAAAARDSEEIAAAASRADTDARNAERYASEADTDARNAATSETNARNSATAAANSATSAANSAMSADSDLTAIRAVESRIDTDVMAIDSDLTTIRRLDSELRVLDSEVRAIQMEIDSDFTVIRRLHGEVDSDARAAGIARDQAQEAANTAVDADNAAARSAAAAAADSDAAYASRVAAAASATMADSDARAADASATRAKSWAVGPSGTGDSGTDTNNAHYWSEQARMHASGHDTDTTYDLRWYPDRDRLVLLSSEGDSDFVTINTGHAGDGWHDSDIASVSNTYTNSTLVTTLTTVGGRNIAAPGVVITGGSTPTPNEHASIMLSANLFEVGRAATTVTITLGVGSGYRFIGTGTQAGAAGNDTLSVRAAGTNSNAGTLTHSAVTANTATVAFAASDFVGTGEYNVSAIIYAYDDNNDSEVVHQQVTAQIRVRRGWYAQRLTSPPTSISNFTGTQGIWTSPQNLTAPTGTGLLYVAFPNRTGGYRMRDGDLRLFAGEGTVFDTNYEYFTTNEAVAGTTYVVEEI